MTARLRRRSVLAVLCLSLHLGCIDVTYPSPGETIRLRPDQVLVFGRVVITDRDRSLFPRPLALKAPRGDASDPVVRLSLFQVENGKKAVFPAIKDDGTFFWILPRGTILVFHTIPGIMTRNEVVAAFQPPLDASAVYVGTLAIEIESEPGSGPPLEYETLHVETGDDFEDARRAFLGRYPEFQGPVARAPMFTDPAFPSLFDDYSRARCLRILADHGLRPISP